MPKFAWLPAISALSASLPAGDGRAAGVTAAADALLRQTEGANGLLAVREREVRSAQVIAGLQGALQKAGDDLRSQVRTLVSQAESDSAATTERSVEADRQRAGSGSSSIAVASLLLAGADRLAVRAALRGRAADRAARQHAGDRAAATWRRRSRPAGPTSSAT